MGCDDDILLGFFSIFWTFECSYLCDDSFDKEVCTITG